MKKRLLFVTLYLHTGGAEKSLLALLSKLDYDKYDVDLLLFEHSGALLDMVPKQVNVLPPLFEAFSFPLAKAVPHLIRNGNLRLLAGKVLSSMLGRLLKGKGIGRRWTIYKYSLKRTNNYYDVAIGYLDFFCNYYAVEKVKAARKIVYNHMDYAYGVKLGWGCPRLERKCFAKSHHVVTVSDSARNSLLSFFPEFKEKISTINNMVSIEAIRNLAHGKGYTDGFDGIRIATVARLTEEKGIWQALDACALLVQQGYKVRWYLIGGGYLGGLRERLQELALEGHFVLLGEKSNPYPYINNCDIYVQPSMTEAHCIAVEEAKVLCKPIVVTNIPSFKLQIVDGQTGVMVPASSGGIAEGISRLITSAKLRQELSENLFLHNGGGQVELEKFYQLIE